MIRRPSSPSTTRQSVRRWVACQCLHRAGNIDEDAGQRLVELALSDPVANVKQVAMRALSACPCVRPLEQLVAALIEYEGTSWLDDPGTNLYGLRSGLVVRLLIERRATATGRERARAEKVLATIDVEFVRDVLARIDSAAAKDALQALPEWDCIGIDARHFRRIAERARTVFEASRRGHIGDLSAATLEDLQRALQEGSEMERIVALELLDARQLLAVDRVFDVLLRDPSQRVRSQAEVILLKRPADVWAARWCALMNDSAWTLRFHVPIDLARDLRRGELSRSWIAALEAHGAEPKDRYCSSVRGGWLIEPGGWSGEVYENDVFQVVNTGSQLAVVDAGVRPRLAILGARLGERALPAIDLFLDENPPYAQIAVLETQDLGADRDRRCHPAALEVSRARGTRYCSGEGNRRVEAFLCEGGAHEGTRRHSLLKPGGSRSHGIRGRTFDRRLDRPCGHR